MPLTQRMLIERASLMPLTQGRTDVKTRRGTREPWEQTLRRAEVPGNHGRGVHYAQRGVPWEVYTMRRRVYLRVYLRVYTLGVHKGVPQGACPRVYLRVYLRVYTRVDTSLYASLCILVYIPPYPPWCTPYYPGYTSHTSLPPGVPQFMSEQCAVAGGRGPGLKEENS